MVIKRLCVGATTFCVDELQWVIYKRVTWVNQELALMMRRENLRVWRGGVNSIYIPTNQQKTSVVAWNLMVMGHAKQLPWLLHSMSMHSNGSSIHNSLEVELPSLCPSHKRGNALSRPITTLRTLLACLNLDHATL